MSCQKWLEKCIIINNKLIFIDSFQFLSSSWDSLVKNLDKNRFQYLSQEFDSKVLYLVKQKGFYLMNALAVLKSLKTNYQAGKRFIVC